MDASFNQYRPEQPAQDSADAKAKKGLSNSIPALVQIFKNIGPFALLGLLFALALLWLFAVLAEDILDKESATLDNNFSLWVHSFASPALNTIFEAFTNIGSIGGIAVLTAVAFGLLLLRGHPHSAWLLVLAVGGGVAINQALKFIFRRPRPELWLGLDPRPGTFSFPSGHATASLCFGLFMVWLGYKFLTSPVLRVRLAYSMAFFILMVGLSRIYLGVHYLTDVIGGYLSGSVWMLVLFSATSIYDRAHPKPPETGRRYST